MADNTTLDPGTGGDVIATDDVAGVKYQRVKLTDGTADSATTINSGNGTAANSLRVTVASDSTGVIGVTDNGGTLTVDDGGGSLTVDGTVAVSGTVTTAESQVLTDNAGFTDGTSKVFPVGLIFDEVAGTALTENDVAAPRIDSKRSQVTVLEDATTRGRRATVTAGGALLTDSSATTQPVSGTVSITANSAVNVAQVAGTTTDTNSGNKSAGTQRVVLATDQPQLTNALKVDGSAVTQPVSGTVTANLGTANVTNAGTFAVQDSEKVADDAAFTVGTTKLMPQGFLADQTSTDSVDEGDIGAARITLDRKQIVTLGPDAATEGLTTFTTIDLNTTDQAVKASAGKLYGYYIYNDSATEAYVKFYNDTTANITVGSSVPVMTFPIPAGSAANVEFSMGIAFSTAITVAATMAAATADTTAPAANAVIANVFYK